MGESSAVVILKWTAFASVKMAVLAAIYKLIMTQELWSQAVAAWRPWSDTSFIVVATFTVHETLYIGVNSMFLLLTKLKLFESFKIYRNSTQTPSKELLTNTFKEWVVGHLITSWVGLYVLARGMQAAGSSVTAPIPDYWTVFVQFMISWQLLNCLFYWAHRVLHARPFYAKIHKQHHEYNGTIGFAAEYANPIEQVLANYLPTAAGPLLLGVHPSVMLTWLAFRLWQTYETHSGYAFPFPLNGMGARYHDYHHSHNVETFGSDPVWDILGGTIAAWNKFIAENPTLDDQKRKAAAKTK